MSGDTQGNPSSRQSPLRPKGVRPRNASAENPDMNAGPTAVRIDRDYDRDVGREFEP
jgi:hypothetical protein